MDVVTLVLGVGQALAWKYFSVVQMVPHDTVLCVGMIRQCPVVQAVAHKAALCVTCAYHCLKMVLTHEKIVFIQEQDITA